ncbi:hypothetical protein MRB53_007633 [Persea americana]|uniref:Uncharacterized protein n=1 Tax=Persea americana TaxID=3435 RepID=A0ACC2MJS9_PERAE|nr:hypothetical protein MRB53_007633 [Persea americana]
MANTTAKVYVIYYSVYGHVGTMAREILRGANSVEGVEATLWQIPETLPDRVLEKMKAPPKDTDVAVIRPEQLAEADGFVFGSPSRFGMMASQVLAFFDATHELCLSQKLAGKPAGIFWSTGFHGGGQENTALTAIPQLAHHGTYAGDGSRQPTELELQQAFYQGKYVAGITKKLKATST